MLRREAGSWKDEAAVALRDLERQAGGDDHALPRSDLMAVAGGEIQPRVTGIGLSRKARVIPEAPDRELDHCEAL